MTPATRPMVKVGDCVPKLVLARVDSPGTVALGDGTYASVLVLPHRSCAECAGWVTEVGEVVEGLRQWAARPVVVLADDDGEADRPPAPAFPVVRDPGGAARARLGIPDHVAALVVTDRWGGVYEVTAAVDDHPAPDGRALVGLVQYIDMQCPECGAPGSEWRACTPLPLG